MTIEQTVEIPASHRIYLDLPGDVPVGKAKVTIVPFAEPPAKAPNAALSPEEAIEKLHGMGKRLGSTFTVDRFLAMKREEIEQDEAEYRHLFHHEDK